jgi:hypothetical protein
MHVVAVVVEEWWAAWRMHVFVCVSLCSSVLICTRISAMRGARPDPCSSPDVVRFPVSLSVSVSVFCFCVIASSFKGTRR